MELQVSRPTIFAAFFGFKRMVSPFFIAIIYFLGLVVIVIVATKAILRGPHLTLDKFGLDFESGLLVAASYGCIILVVIATVFLWRFCCEMLMVCFGINQQLVEIKATLEGVEETKETDRAITGIESITNEKEQRNSLGSGASKKAEKATETILETAEQVETIEPIKGS